MPDSIMNKRHLIVAFSTLAVLSAAGCAGTQTHPDPARQSSSSVDHTYMHEVERRAKRTGVQVRWVNPPRRVQRTTGEEEET